MNHQAPSSENSKSVRTSSIKKDMITGSAWMVSMRWVIRSIGLVSTIILARLLLPEDFGLVAMAMLIAGLLDILMSFGVDLALIQNPKAERKHFDTAWTIQVLQGVFTGTLLLTLAPAAASYFDEPRVIPLIQVITIGVFFQGFTNIGIVAFRKELDFMREFRFMVSKKLITFFVTIGMALLLRNYWALAIGIITGQVLSVALSYAMHSYRPKFSLQAIRDIWSFSQWMLVTNIGDYAYNKADEFIVGGMIGTKNLGVYTVSSEIANLPTTELVFPISRALFPGFAKLTDDLQRLSAAYLNVLGFIALFAIAAGVGVLSVASDFVLVVLGSNWVDAIPVIQWLAVFGLIRAVYGQAGSVFLALGHVRALALLIWLQVILLIIFVYFGSLSGGIVGAAVGKVSVAVIFATILFYALMRIIPLTLSNISSRLWRPILASLVMAFTINFFHNSIFTSPPLSLLHDIIIGTLVYIAAILTLWHISGRPKGAEQFLFDFVINKFNRKDLKCPKQNQKSP